jgi:hypothetical protein
MWGDHSGTGAREKCSLIAAATALGCAMLALIDRISAPFALQFAPDGDGFIYRKSLKGAPVRVTAAERDGFVASFRRWMRYAFVAMVAGFLGVVVLMVAAVPSPDSPYATLWMGGGIAVVVAAFAGAVFRAWAAPARSLAGRPVLGAPRSADEMRRINLASISYGRLALAGFMVVFVVGSRALTTDLLHGWGRLQLALGVALLCLPAVQAFRKWREERR